MSKEKLKHLQSVLLGIDPGIMDLYYRFMYKPNPSSIEYVIDQKARGKHPFYFLQIGGNDGFIKDPIFKFVKRYPWKGIIAEPQKEVFNKRLKNTYRNEKKVILENVAIADNKGIKRLYKLAVSSSRWATGLATFNRATLEYQIKRKYVDDRLKKEGIDPPKNMDGYITFEEVECTTIPDLLTKHRIKQLDLLQIDTEGYDFEIIKTIDFSNLKPSIISFESEHLSREDRLECETLLIHNGYSIKHIGRDSIACM